MEKENALRLSRIFYFNKYVDPSTLSLFRSVFNRFPTPPPFLPFPVSYLWTFVADYRHPVILVKGLKSCRVTGNSLTLEDALSFESSARPVGDGRQTEQHQQAAGEETGTLTFAELKTLIEQGKTDGIPNNKVIPNILNVSSFNPPMSDNPS